MRFLSPILACLTAALVSTGCAATAGGAVEENWIQTSDGVLLHYQQIGSGPEVLVVPGASWVAEDMQELARGRTVIFYDPRGRGRSEARPTTDIERDLKDLEEVRAWMKLEHFALLGMDYNGALAAHYAARNPEHVTELVIVSPIPLRKFPHWKIYNKVFTERQDNEAFERLNEMKRQGVNRREPETWALAYGRALMESWVREPSSVRSMKSTPYVTPNLDPEIQIVRYFEMLKAWGDWDWRTTMSGVACPTLVVFGDTDPMPVQAIEEWAEIIPGAGKHVVARSGRLPWVESSRDFFATVNAFLD